MLTPGLLQLLKHVDSKLRVDGDYDSVRGGTGGTAQVDRVRSTGGLGLVSGSGLWGWYNEGAKLSYCPIITKCVQSSHSSRPRELAD